MAVSVRTYELNIWQLNTQLGLVRFSNRHLSEQQHIREEFLRERTEQIYAGYTQLARQKPELFGPFEDIHRVFAKRESEWLRNNLNAVIEFSEHRINQMELVLRYAFFEAATKDVVGNILWETRELIENDVHKSLHTRPIKRLPNDDDDDFRGKKTAELVNAVAKLSHKPRRNTSESRNERPHRPACLSEYFCEGLDLAFGQERFSDTLDTVKETRNKIAHRATVSPTVLTTEFMAQARSALSELPRQLIHSAAEAYPDACTTEAPDGESELPGYVIRQILKEI